MAERSPDGYSRVEHELAVLLRRAHANSGDLPRDVHPELQATGYACWPAARPGRCQGGGPQRPLRHRQGCLSRQLTLLQDLQLGDLLARFNPEAQGQLRTTAERSG